MTAIGYGTKRWDPAPGCKPTSPGCRLCWAARDLWRQSHNPKLSARGFAALVEKKGALPRFTGRTAKAPIDIWTQPARWRKPERVLVGFNGDLFWHGHLRSDITAVFDTALATPRHTYLFLTKRPALMVTLLRHFMRRHGLKRAPENWWFGISAEDQKRFDARIGQLMQLRPIASVLWLSLEPLLEGIVFPYRLDIDWVVTGGESGKGARWVHPQKYRDIRAWCAARGVAFWHKQNGEWLHEIEATAPGRLTPPQLKRAGMAVPPDPEYRGFSMFCVGKKLAGDLLDGHRYNELPNRGRNC